MKKLLLFITLIAFCMTSCEKDEKINIEKEIKFSLSVPTAQSDVGGRITALPEPTTLLVTIKDEDGTTVADRKELTLYKFGETFLSLPLTLNTSEGANYKLTEFFVLGADNQVAYVTPIEGSAMAHLVADALDIEFAISKDQITTVTPEVLALDDNAIPKEYGYGQFGFSVVKTINTVFSSFIKGVSNFELTESHLKIEGLADTTSLTALWTWEGELEARANIVVIKEASFYRITATKNGFADWISIAPLLNNERIEILFEEAPDGGGSRVWNVAFNQGGWDNIHGSAPTHDGGSVIIGTATYSTSINVSRLGSNGQVLWKKRYNDPATMGSSLYSVLQAENDDGFYLGGYISCTLIDADKCTPSDSFSSLTGWITRIDGDGNYLWSKHIPNTLSVSEITRANTPGNIMVFGFRQVHSASGILPQYVLTELNEAGDIVWQKQYLQGYSYRANFVRVNDGYLVTKIYDQYDYVNASITKLNFSGDVQWTNTNLPANWYWGPTSVVETLQGYLVTATQRNVQSPDFDGCTNNLPNGATDLVLAMLSNNGAVQWVKTIERRTHEKLSDSKLLPSGNILLGGIAHTACRNDVNYIPRWFFMEVSAEGEVVSEITLTGSRVDVSLGRSPEMYMEGICQVRSNEFIVVGSTNIIDGDTPDVLRTSSDAWAMKLRF